MEDVAHADELVRVGSERTHRLLASLRELSVHEFYEPSELPGWDRLTITCHLRYGTRALLRMARDGLAGRETSYYPAGRHRQRPATLRPAPGERPSAVLDDWGSAATELDRAWSAIRGDRWSIDVVEPSDNPDLGTVPLARLALARLTEVDVHGTDLGIGIPDWSSVLVDVGLPTRLCAGSLHDVRTTTVLIDQSTAPGCSRQRRARAGSPALTTTASSRGPRKRAKRRGPRFKDPVATSSLCYSVALHSNPSGSPATCPLQHPSAERSRARNALRQVRQSSSTTSASTAPPSHSNSLAMSRSVTAACAGVTGKYRMASTLRCLAWWSAQRTSSR